MAHFMTNRLKLCGSGQLHPQDMVACLLPNSSVCLIILSILLSVCKRAKPEFRVRCLGFQILGKRTRKYAIVKHSNYRILELNLHDVSNTQRNLSISFSKGNYRHFLYQIATSQDPFHIGVQIMRDDHSHLFYILFLFVEQCIIRFRLLIIFFRIVYQYKIVYISGQLSSHI